MKGRCKENMKNFRMNRKGISPIFATLILIAIAVIAGVVVYAFTSGMLSGMTANSSAGQEKITVQSASYSGGVVTVWLQSTGGPNPVINSLILKDSSGNTVANLGLASSGSVAPTPSLANGALSAGTLYTIKSGTYSGTPALSGSYTVTVITNAGGNFVSPSFTV